MSKVRIAAAAVIAAVSVGFLVPSGPVGAQVPHAEADYKGYATGSTAHVDALQAGITGPRVADVDVAFSASTVASKGTSQFKLGPNAKDGQIVSETDTLVQPALPNTTLNANLKGDRSYGRGSGLEVGLGSTLPVSAAQLILAGKSQASAPPSTELLTSQIGPLPTNPVAYASLLRGQSQARWNTDGTCILGEPISQGLGYAADVQLANTGAANPDGTMKTPVLATDAPTPERRVSQSRSIEQLVPQTGADNAVLGPNFGLMSEVRMTIAPITLFKGAANQVTIEVAGEWVLRAVATGVGGQAGNWVTYGPGNVSPQTPLVSIIQGTTTTTILTTQQILGQAGLVVPLPGGLGEIAIGEDPRAIGGDAASQPTRAANGTNVAAAVDVVRIKLIEQKNAAGQVTQAAADLRVGHMETAATVPAGGIACALPVKKTVDKPDVVPGDVFTYEITVTNPFADCDLTNVKVVDTITVDPGILYTITSSEPPANDVTANSLTWNDIGPIKPKESKSVKVTITVSPNSGGGLFVDKAVATGTCGTGSARGDARIPVTLNGEVILRAPMVTGQLPATGGYSKAAVLGLLALASGYGIYRVRKEASSTV